MIISFNENKPRLRVPCVARLQSWLKVRAEQRSPHTKIRGTKLPSCVDLVPSVIKYGYPYKFARAQLAGHFQPLRLPFTPSKQILVFCFDKIGRAKNRIIVHLCTTHLLERRERSTLLPDVGLVHLVSQNHQLFVDSHLVSKCID